MKKIGPVLSKFMLIRLTPILVPWSPAFPPREKHPYLFQIQRQDLGSRANPRGKTKMDRWEATPPCYIEHRVKMAE